MIIILIFLQVTEDAYPEIYAQQRKIHRSLNPGCRSSEDISGVYFKSVKGPCEMGESKSWKNAMEAKSIVKIYESLILCGIKDASIGIITPYLDQVKIIRESIKSTSVVIGSVDSFQGQERDVILVSTVRSIGCRGIGFVGDQKRLNVTLSRAKTALVIVGNDEVLRGNKLFRDFFDMGGICFLD